MGNKKQVFTKQCLLEKSVKEIQDLRSSKKLLNVIGMDVGQINQLILAKLPSSRTLGPFITELEYYSSDNILVKEDIIKKLENAFPKIVKHIELCELPKLDYMIGTLKNGWVKSLLLDVLNKFNEMSQISPMVVHGLCDAESGKSRKYY